MATSKNKILINDILICDSGAYRHYFMSNKGLFDVNDIDKKITVGNGESINSTKVGSLKRHVVQLDGSSANVILKEVKYVP
jgi:hypothetical protein